MKNFKKRWLTLLLCLVATVFGICFAACNNSNNNVVSTDEYIAISVVDATENESLIVYMQNLQNDGKLTFTVENGMVTSINDISQAANCYWMLYTSDTDNANNAWGTYEYDGQTLGSSMLGAESLTVKNGCVYVWVYTQF